MGVGTTNPDGSAILDVSSTTKGLLIPRMTTVQREAMINEEEGLLIFNLTTSTLEYFNGTEWLTFSPIPAYGWRCGMKWFDTRDGKSYNTIKVGNICYLAQNINVGVMINSSQPQTDNGIIEKYCYNNLESNCDIYGGLYEWGEAMQYDSFPPIQGVCPCGWHVPDDFEFEELIFELGGDEVAGGKMKEPGFEHWAPPNAGATNESGLCLQGSGCLDPSGLFMNLLTFALYWRISIDKMMFMVKAADSGIGRINTFSTAISIMCMED